MAFVCLSALYEKSIRLCTYFRVIKLDHFHFEFIVIINQCYFNKATKIYLQRYIGQRFNSRIFVTLPVRCSYTNIYLNSPDTIFEIFDIELLTWLRNIDLVLDAAHCLRPGRSVKARYCIYSTITNFIRKS